jgi:hypothetical protein
VDGCPAEAGNGWWGEGEAGADTMTIGYMIIDRDVATGTIEREMRKHDCLQGVTTVSLESG